VNKKQSEHFKHPRHILLMNSYGIIPLVNSEFNSAYYIHAVYMQLINKLEFKTIR